MNRWCRAVSATCAVVVVTGTARAQPPNSGMRHMGDGGVMYHAPRWSPDGKWLVVSSNLDGDAEIYLIRPDGGAFRQLTRNNIPDDNARWSADGRRILFERKPSGATVQSSMDLEGGDIRTEPLDSVVSRSPDGTQLLFESVRDGRGRLFLMTSARTNAREIPTAPHAEQGSFSPDGRSIVFEQRNAMHEDIARSAIAVARSDGSSPTVVASGTDPSWSRDGTLILFKTLDERTQELWISTVLPTGEGLKRLAPGMHPNWSPDGLRIAYMADRKDGGADVWIMHRDGSAAHCLTCAAPFR